MQAGMNKGAEYEHMNKLSELGLRATWLVLGHTEWVKRRVEGIQFRPGGDTRRRISFDVSIPPHYLITGDEIGASGSEEGPSKLAVVPLTFMGKGSLVNLDLSDRRGDSVSSVGFTENGKITVAALEWLANRLQSLTRTETFCQETFHKAFKAIVYSWNGQTEWTKAIDDQNQRNRDRLRHKVFSSLLNEIDERTNNTESQPYPIPAFVNQEEGKHVRDLILWLKEIIELSVGERRPIQDDTSTSTFAYLCGLLLLLSTVSISYVFTALLPVREVRERTVIKLAFDTDIDTSPDERTGLNLWGILDLFERWRISTEYSLAFATYGASSIHAELTPAPGTELISLTREHINIDKPFDDTVMSGDDVKTAPLNARTIGERVHLELNAHAFNPLVRTVVGVCMRGDILKSTMRWSIGTSAFLIFCCALLLVKPEALAKFFTADNVIAGTTLIFALWVAQTITTHRHHVEGELIQLPRLAMTWSVAMIAIGFGSLALATSPLGHFDPTSFNGESPADSLAVHLAVTRIFFVINLVMLVLSLSISINTFSAWRLRGNLLKKWRLRLPEGAPNRPASSRGSWTVKFESTSGEKTGKSAHSLDFAEEPAFQCVYKLSNRKLFLDQLEIIRHDAK